VACYVWRVVCGVLCVACCVWRVMCGVLCVACYVWRVMCGVLCVACYTVWPGVCVGCCSSGSWRLRFPRVRHGFGVARYLNLAHRLAPHVLPQSAAPTHRCPPHLLFIIIDLFILHTLFIYLLEDRDQRQDVSWAEGRQRMSGSARGSCRLSLAISCSIEKQPRFPPACYAVHASVTALAMCE
jgi:hypothetical protein